MRHVSSATCCGCAPSSRRTRSNSGCFNENTNDAVSFGENPWIAREREISRNSSRASVHASDDGSSYAAGLEGRLDAGKKPLRLVVELAVADEVESRCGRRALLRKPGSQQRLRVAGYKLRKTRRGRGCHVVLLRVFVGAHRAKPTAVMRRYGRTRILTAKRALPARCRQRCAVRQASVRAATRRRRRRRRRDERPRNRRGRRPTAIATGAPCLSARARGSATSVPCHG